MSIFFFSEKIKFKPKGKSVVIKWLYSVAVSEGYSVDELNYIFCNDDYLLELNKKYLNHNTLTDIITFDYSENQLSEKGNPKKLNTDYQTPNTEHRISGDIFISIERIKENAEKYNTTFDEELHRIMVHGLLHLLGYKDKKPGEKILMRKKEDFYLSARAF